MRRKDKEVTSREWIEDVLHSGQWLELSMSGTDGWPYVVPLNYAYDEGYVIIHGARDGKKIDILRANPKVCLNVAVDTEVIRNETDPSAFSMKYKSVTAYGTAEFIEDICEKKRCLQILMRHYKGPLDPMPDAMLTVTSVIKIKITEMTGKVSYYARPA